MAPVVLHREHDTTQSLEPPRKRQRITASSLEQKDEYVYVPLREGDIRFVDLLPGLPDDDIHVELFHARLPTGPPAEDLNPVSRLSQRELQQTCPKGWEVSETPEGKYVFDGPGITQYAHPNPSIPPDRYAPLRDPPPVEPIYEALSYAWGSAEPFGMVLVSTAATSNVEKRDGFLWIGRNLEEALRNIRLADKPRRLWIDAICINQHSIVERNKQVPLMGEIFPLAWRVLIWLGPATEDSSLAIAALQSLSEQVEVAKGAWAMRRPGTNRSADLHDYNTPLLFTKRQWDSLKNFFDRSWFKRLWTTMEIVLASSRSVFQCGSEETISWYRLRRAISCLDGRAEAPFEISSTSSLRLCIYESGRGSTGVFLIFTRQWYQICSDPRDRVYGNLSMMSERIARNIRPSYAASIRDVYKDAFLEVCRATKRLNFLVHCEWRESENTAEDDTYASWVPRWGGLMSHGRWDHDCHAAGISKASFEHDARVPEVLSVVGVRHSRIRNVVGQRRASTAFASLPLSALRDDLSFSLEAMETGTYPTGESRLDAFTKVLHLNRFQERDPPSKRPTFEACKERVSEILKNVREKSTDGLDTMLLGQVAAEFEHKAAFLNTENDYLGFGPQGTEAGDLVCVFLGCMRPMIVRQISHAPDKYRIIGDAYIQGLMDSDALLGHLPEGWSVQVKHVDGLFIPEYLNHETDDLQLDDPRLPPLGKEWKWVEREMDPDDYPHADYFENVDTGEVMNSDPRLLPENLRAMGVPLRSFDLV